MLPLFNATGKKHYYEIDLKQMEDPYSQIPYKYLHLLGINHTVPLYAGVDGQGDPMGNWVLESLNETVQKYYHKMNFHTGKSNGWFRYSLHMVVISKASRVVMEECSHLQSTKDKDTHFIDHSDMNIKTGKGAKAVKKSCSPKCERESCAVAEYLKLSKMTREISNRQYNDNEMWDVINQCAVELISETEKSRTERMVRECQAEEEILLDKFNDSLYNWAEDQSVETDDTNGINTSIDLVIDESSRNVSNEDDSFKLDPAAMATPNEFDTNVGDKADLAAVTVENKVHEVSINGFGNVKKAAINGLSINHDIMVYGKAEVK